MNSDSRVEWLARFSAELRLRRPILSLVAVRQMAVEAFEREAGTTPEEAASKCACEPPLSAFDRFESLRVRQSQAAWIRAFAKCLFLLQGSIRGRNATTAARRSYQDACDLSPEEAAEIYAAALPPPHVGAPGD